MSKTIGDKLKISFRVALIFLLVSLPYVYSLTDKFAPLRTTQNGCPTIYGRLLHGLLFFLINLIMMKLYNSKEECKQKSFGTMIKYAFYGTLLTYVLSDPGIYKLTNTFANKYNITTSNNGCPTLYGVASHSLVYVAILTTMMYFSKDTKKICPEK
jgi:hypothetical protein